MNINRNKIFTASLFVIVLLQIGQSEAFIVRISTSQSRICAGSHLIMDVELQNTSKHAVRLAPRAVEVVYFRQIPLAGRDVEKLELLPESPDAQSHEQSSKLYSFHGSEGLGYSYDCVDTLPGKKGLTPLSLKAGKSFHHSISIPLSDDTFKANRFYKLRLRFGGLLSGDAKTPDSNEIVFAVRECK